MSDMEQAVETFRLFRATLHEARAPRLFANKTHRDALAPIAKANGLLLVSLSSCPPGFVIYAPQNRNQSEWVLIRLRRTE